MPLTLSLDLKIFARVRVLFMRFIVRKYREDFAGLTHVVIDTSDLSIVDEALTPEDAEDLADTMNSLDRYYRDLEVKDPKC